MAKHIMAVCVVCLLFAEHVPCQEHLESGNASLLPPPQMPFVNENTNSNRDSNNNNNNNKQQQHDSAERQRQDDYRAHQQRFHSLQARAQRLKLNAQVFQRTDTLSASSAVSAAISSSTPSPATLSATETARATTTPTTTTTITNSRGDPSGDNEWTEGTKLLHRHRRHAGHGWEDAHVHPPEITELFLRLLAKEYGAADGIIDTNAFQSILRHLGLNRLLPRNSPTDRDTCISDKELVEHVRPHHHPHGLVHYKAQDELHVHEPMPMPMPVPPSSNTKINSSSSSKVNCSNDANGSATTHPQCLPGGEKSTRTPRMEPANYSLSTMDVLNLCPILLYQLTSPIESVRSGCIEPIVLTDIDNFEAAKIDADKEDMIYVWVYAFTSVFACSILGLVGVAIIPFMDSRYYKHIIQFLVSLAVGTMTGDALLHLVPHSLAGQTEQNMIFKGLTCMGGIIFFYMTEHGLTMISEWRKRIAKREAIKPARAKVVRDPDSSITNSVAGDKLCKSKYSSYPYCYDEIAMDTKNDIHLPMRKLFGAGGVGVVGGGAGAGAGGGKDVSKDAIDNIMLNVEHHKRNGLNDLDAGNEMAAQSLLSTSQNNYTPICDLGPHQNNINHHHLNHQQHNRHQQTHLPDSNTISTDLDGNSLGDAINANNASASASTSKEKLEDKETAAVTVILREHESSHHGHSHKHGHVHSPPESLSAVAWMIIMGDGLHNFTDGMAIGAAFAENVAGGFSTSLAVFCHELPHELGDFAILLKAGMSVRSAVYYNLLTGLLSFIGMIFGIIFGQSQETAQWMFAAAAGLFIYIALVDMMPELSSSHKTVEQFILQILGMSSGVFIMLLIAIYEGDLMNVFSGSPGHQH